MKLSKTGLGLIVLALLAAQGLFFQYRFYADRQRLAAEVDELWQARRSLETDLSTLREESAALRQQLRERGIEPAAAPPPARGVTEPGRVEAVRELSQLQTKYSSLQASVIELQNRAGELEGALERVRSENAKLTAAETDLKDQLASTQRVVQAMDAELKSKADRVAQLESSLKRFRDEASGADRRLSQVSGVIRELEDINRRRENYLNALQRRYRDVSDQLRALALRIDTQRDSPTPIGATDISRITSAVQSAEDDLRQLISLTTQAENVTKRLR